jgi:hypothetical protein
VSATGAGGAVTPPAIDPPMGADLDLQDRAVVGPGEVRDGLPAMGTPPLSGGAFEDLFDRGQVVISAAWVSGSPPLLSAPPWRGGARCDALDGGRGVGLAPEELLLAEAELGLEPSDLVFERRLAFDGPLMHGLPVGGLAPGLELLGQAWADRTGPLG